MTTGSFTVFQCLCCLALIVGGVTAQQFMMPLPMFPSVPMMPVGTGMWSGPRNRFADPRNNMFLQQQQRWNTFAPFPMNGNMNGWNNNQIPNIPASTIGNTFTTNQNTGLQTNDPWAQYRLFSSGVNSVIGSTPDGTSGSIVPANQISTGFTGNNQLWNSFPASNGLNGQQFSNVNGQMIGTSGFLNPQLPSNNVWATNNQVANGGLFGQTQGLALPAGGFRR